MNAKKLKISVAEYLTQQIAVSGVSQKNLADQLGYDKPNIITMFKQGKTKVPLNKIAPIAKILGIDRVNFSAPGTDRIQQGNVGGSGRNPRSAHRF